MYKTLTNGAISGETYFPLLFLLLYPITFSVLTYHSVHCGSIRQTATILSMNRDCLRTGDKASVHFRFIKTPEYLHCDQRLVFREGRTKAVGTITKVVQPSGTSTKDDERLCIFPLQWCYKALVKWNNFKDNICNFYQRKYVMLKTNYHGTNRLYRRSIFTKTIH